MMNNLQKIGEGFGVDTQEMFEPLEGKQQASQSLQMDQ